MNSIKHTYFNILRNYLWKDSASVEGMENWDDVIRLAATQGTLPLLADFALKQKENAGPSVQQKMQMRQMVMQNMLHRQKLHIYLRLVKECLDNAGIPFVVLKGDGLAALHPNPDMRIMSDVDIWVGQERFHEACHVLRTLPDVLTEDKQEEEGTRHFNLHWENAQYVIEVHPVTHAFPSKKENAHYQEWEKTNILHPQLTILLNDEQYNIPPCEFNVFYVFLHMWHHYLDKGLHVKQMIDWVLVLHDYAKNQSQQYNQQLCEELKFYHLIEPWQAFGWVAVNYLGLPANEMPRYNDDKRTKHQAELLLNYMLSGNQRLYLNQKKRGSGMLHKLVTIRFMWLDYRTTRQIFPAYARYHLWSSACNSIKRML